MIYNHKNKIGTISWSKKEYVKKKHIKTSRLNAKWGMIEQERPIQEIAIK